MLNMNLLTKKTLSFIELNKAPMPFEDNGLGELFCLRPHFKAIGKKSLAKAKWV